MPCIKSSSTTSSRLRSEAVISVPRFRIFRNEEPIFTVAVDSDRFLADDLHRSISGDDERKAEELWRVTLTFAVSRIEAMVADRGRPKMSTRSKCVK